MPRADRLLHLVQLLRRHRQPVSAATLADELGISIRSVYRDVQSLRGQGAVIEGEAGIGYLLRPGFLLPPLMFTDEELEAIVLGLRLTVEHGDAALGRSAAEVVAKLRAVLPRELRELFDETALLAGPARFRPGETIDLREVRRAIREQRKAQIEYLAPPVRDAPARAKGVAKLRELRELRELRGLRELRELRELRGRPRGVAPLPSGEGRRTTRIIWPIGIGFFERSRVVIAWCEERRDFRSFRADRIKRFALLSEKLPRSRLILLREWREREGIAAQLPG